MSRSGRTAVTATILTLAVVLAGCTHGAARGGGPGTSSAPSTAPTVSPGSGGRGSASGTSTADAASSAVQLTSSGAVPGDDDTWCASIRQDWPGIAGRTVRIAADVTKDGAAALRRSWSDFASCTGAAIDLEPTGAVVGAAASATPPDIVVLDRPREIATLARNGTLTAAPPEVLADVDRYYDATWKGLGSVDGTLYAVPFDVTVQSLVWYSPAMFERMGYRVPTTWDEMTALSDTIATSGTVKPWCAGIAAATAPGRPVSNWLAEAVLRRDGPGAYDRWVSGSLPFTDPGIAGALDVVGSILRNPRYVNGGAGGVASILTTSAADAGRAILSGRCYLMQAGQDYAWPAGTTVGPHGDVAAFYLPPIGDTFGRPVVVDGTFAAALDADPATSAALYYLSTAHWADNQAAASAPGVSANRGLRPSSVRGALDAVAVQILHDPQAVVRFEASELMPAPVGDAALSTQLTAWVAGQDDASTLAGIAQAWPPATS